jgi:membrane protease YdiL (CAAX protease family)
MFLEIVLLLMLFWLIVWAVIAFFVYEDAADRDMDNAGLWAFLVFMFGLLGLILYLVFRGEKKK